MGIIILIMGIKTISMADALFSKTQQRVLGLLFTQPDSSFYTNEIIRLTHSGTGAVQRELDKLSLAGLITLKETGNQKHYQANPALPIYEELRSIILKTFGLANIVSEALSPLKKQIQFAFIYGSIAKQTDTASSDIDLMLITDQVTYAEIFEQLEKAEAKLGRKIHPTFYSASEWQRKYQENNNFLIQVIKQPKIFLIGTEDGLTCFR